MQAHMTQTDQASKLSEINLPNNANTTLIC